MNNIIAETDILIHAPIEKVWQVVTDVNNYPEWNPFVVRAETNGSTVARKTNMKFYIVWGNGHTENSNEVVADAKAPHKDAEGVLRAHWSYRFNGWLHYFGLVRAIRYQWLHETEPGKTVYRTREEFKGLLKNFVPLALVQDGFERQAKALKNFTEQNGN